jgi:hypothetical protein
MPHLLLRPEIQCYPLWVEKGGIDENTDPSSLPLSAGLVEALEDWAARWDATYDPDDPLNSGFASPEEERRFREDGVRLEARLRTELGERWTVSSRIPV